jgi:uncharacterized protein (UPF0264 family)
LPAAVVPLLFADGGLDLALVEAACALGFPIVMVDTAQKHGQSLFDCVAQSALQRMLHIVHGSGARAGVAGSLRREHVRELSGLLPDIAGFRGALCDGARTGHLNADKVRDLRRALPPLDARHGLGPQRRSTGATVARYASS